MAGTCLYRCQQCGEVWRSDTERHTYTHRHAAPERTARERIIDRAWARPDPPPWTEHRLELFEDDGRALDDDHDLRLGVWMA